MFLACHFKESCTCASQIALQARLHQESAGQTVAISSRCCSEVSTRVVIGQARHRVAAKVPGFNLMHHTYTYINIRTIDGRVVTQAAASLPPHSRSWSSSARQQRERERGGENSAGLTLTKHIRENGSNNGMVPDMVPGKSRKTRHYWPSGNQNVPFSGFPMAI